MLALYYVEATLPPSTGPVARYLLYCSMLLTTFPPIAPFCYHTPGAVFLIVVKGIVPSLLSLWSINYTEYRVLRSLRTNPTSSTTELKDKSLLAYLVLFGPLLRATAKVSSAIPKQLLIRVVPLVFSLASVPTLGVLLNPHHPPHCGVIFVIRLFPVPVIL